MARLDPLDSTKKQLFAACRGLCTICKAELFREVGGQPLQIGELAHICATSVAGPRYDAAMDDEACRAFENLMVLCPSCHVEVDAAVHHYTVEVMRALKREHEGNRSPQETSGDAGLLLRQHPAATLVLVFSAEGSSRTYAAKRRYHGPAPVLVPGTPYRLDDLDRDFILRTPRVTENGIELWSEPLELPDADSLPDIHLREHLRAAGWEILHGCDIDAPD